MGKALDGITFKAEDPYDAKKMEKFASAAKEDIDTHRSEINDLQRDKTGMIERGEVTEPGQIDISDVPENTFVKWKEEGNRCMGVVLDGELVVIKGRR